MIFNAIFPAGGASGFTWGVAVILAVVSGVLLSRTPIDGDFIYHATRRLLVVLALTGVACGCVVAWG